MRRSREKARFFARFGFFRGSRSLTKLWVLDQGETDVRVEDVTVIEKAERKKV